MSNFEDIVKSQLLTLGILNNNSTGKGTENNGILLTIIGLVIMKMIDIIVQITPVVTNFVNKKIENYIETKKEIYNDQIFTVETNILSSINFNVTQDNITDDTIQSILKYICNQNSARDLRYTTQFFINNKEEFKLNHKDVKCVVKGITFKKEKLENLVFEIYSKN